MCDNEFLKAIESERKMQQGYQNQDYYSPEDLEDSSKAVFYLGVFLILLVLGMFFYAGYKAASYKQLQEFLNGTSTVSNLDCRRVVSHGAPQNKP